MYILLSLTKNVQNRWIFKKVINRFRGNLYFIFIKMLIILNLKLCFYGGYKLMLWCAKVGCVML